MADWRSTGGIALKALVDKANNKIVYVESDEYFVDVLFSFLTLPIGAAIKLTSIFTEPPRIGCMNNIYESVKNLDDRRLQPEVSKKMLLEPKSAADPYFRNVEEFMLYDRYPSVRCYYLCGWCDFNLISRYEGARCHCGNLMSSRYDFPLTRQPAYDGVFVKGLSRFAVTDELEVRPLSTASTISLLSKLGLSDLSTIEERTIIAGADKVLNLLKCSLVSEIPLSEALLGHEPAHVLGQRMSFTAQNKPERKIRVKLMVGEYSGRVYYAEAGGDFVDLLFSFLTVPLGYIFQKLQGSSVGGCLSHLHSSVANLDTENYLKSEEHKETLLSPKLAPGFGYDEQLLEIEEALSEPLYVFKIDSFNRRVTTDATIASQRSATPVTLTGLKTQCGEASDRNRGVYVKGGTQFTVTDDLVIAPVSSISGFSVLKKLHVPLTDLVQRDVHVGKGEALNLLLASFASESALTDAFMDQIQV